MPVVLIALLLAIGIAGWTYSKITQRTGGLTQSDMIVTGVVGLLVFMIAWGILNSLMD